MRFAAPDDNRWRTWFAILPLRIGGRIVWLERYRYRPRGEYVEVDFYGTPDLSGGKAAVPSPRTQTPDEHKDLQARATREGGE